MFDYWLVVWIGTNGEMITEAFSNDSQSGYKMATECAEKHNKSLLILARRMDRINWEENNG